jgi:hypothetical protein
MYSLFFTVIDISDVSYEFLKTVIKSAVQAVCDTSGIVFQIHIQMR